MFWARTSSFWRTSPIPLPRIRKLMIVCAALQRRCHRAICPTRSKTKLLMRSIPPSKTVMQICRNRYYRLKAKWFGVDQLDYWDRNAPLPDDDDRQIDWDTARSTVLKAYGEFSPELAEVGQKFFDNPWIDVPPRAGKSSWCLCPSDGAVSTPLPAFELSRQDARCDDACP